MDRTQSDHLAERQSADQPDRHPDRSARRDGVAADLGAIFADRPHAPRAASVVRKHGATTAHANPRRPLRTALIFGAATLALAAVLILWLFSTISYPHAAPTPIAARAPNAAPIAVPPTTASAVPPEQQASPAASEPSSDTVAIAEPGVSYRAVARPVPRDRAPLIPYSRAATEPVPAARAGATRPAASRAPAIAERPRAAPARAATSGSCDQLDGVERRAWCMRPRVLAADQQLRVAYDAARRAGVNVGDLGRLQRRWAGLQHQAVTDPQGAIAGYEDLRGTLANMVAERGPRRAAR